MELLTLYYAKRLRSLGYPSDNVRYSLSWSQGDGVAFFGKLTAEGLLRLAQRCLLGAGRVQAFITLQPMILDGAISAEIEKRGDFNGHHDAGSMLPGIVVHADRGDDFDHELDAALELMETAMGEDVRVLSLELAQIGYDCIDAWLTTAVTLYEGPIDGGYERLTLEPADPDPDPDVAADEDADSLERFIRSMTGARVGDAVLRRFRSSTSRTPTAEAREFTVHRGDSPRSIARLRARLAARLEACAPRHRAA